MGNSVPHLFERPSHRPVQILRTTLRHSSRCERTRPASYLLTFWRGAPPLFERESLGVDGLRVQGEEAFEGVTVSWLGLGSPPVA
jgi:hypothetical protein